MKASIDNADKLINPSHTKEILSALNRINKGFQDLNNLGYGIYITPDSVNVMNDSTQNHDDVVASISIRGVDCGDW